MLIIKLLLEFKDLKHSFLFLQTQEGDGFIIRLIFAIKVDRMEEQANFCSEIEILQWLSNFSFRLQRELSRTRSAVSFFPLISSNDFFHPKNNGKHCFWHTTIFPKRVTSPLIPHPVSRITRSVWKFVCSRISQFYLFIYLFLFFIFYCAPFITQRRPRAWRNFTFRETIRILGFENRFCTNEIILFGQLRFQLI